MCGRFSLTTPEPQILERFSVLAPESGYKPRFNCAPTQKLAVVTDGNPVQISMFKWGMTDLTVINAKLETLLDKPMFHDAHRCLVLADGFYEWKAVGTRKVPFRVILPDGQPFAMAGIWRDGEFAIITVPSCQQMDEIHDRMPAILEPTQEAAWLKTPLYEGVKLLGPYDKRIKIYAVSPLVNSVGADSPALTKPLTTLGDF